MQKLITLIALFFANVVLSANVNAAWFTATGQAVVIDGDTQLARKEATEEAIRQALLFAGASVTSVQQMTNGLLMDEQLEIRASGEVNTIQLIDEVHQDGVITVSIRADIFAQHSECSAADYTKKLATTYFPIRFAAQASDGSIHKFGESAALKFKQLVDRSTTNMNISHLEPYVLDWQLADVAENAQALANKSNTQYIVTLVIDDISVTRQNNNSYNPFASAKNTRSFDFTLSLVNGASGEAIYSQSYSSVSPWEFEFGSQVDVSSAEFWRSHYGKSAQRLMQASIRDLEEFTMCQPTMGRVLAVANNQLQINLGRSHKVQTGDRLTLFNLKQVTDTFGQQYQQFVLHPTQLVVRQVYSDTATVEPADNGLLMGVQPNDYVARQ